MDFNVCVLDLQISRDCLQHPFPLVTCMECAVPITATNLNTPSPQGNLELMLGPRDILNLQLTIQMGVKVLRAVEQQIFLLSHITKQRPELRI